jgi:hypothetical protein
VRVACGAACRLSGRLILGGGTARRFGLGRHSATIASGRGHLDAAGTTAVTLRLTARAKRRLAGAHALRTTLRIVATGEGQRTRASRVIALT